MAKALINEKRDTITANSEDFSFEYDHKTEKIEIYFNNDKLIVKQEEEVSVESYIETALVGLDDIWRKVSEYLIYFCGKMVDIAWFSKLELVIKDEINNKFS